MFIHCQRADEFGVHFVAGDGAVIHRNDRAAALRPEPGLARAVDDELVPVAVLAR